MKKFKKYLKRFFSVIAIYTGLIGIYSFAIWIVCLLVGETPSSPYLIVAPAIIISFVQGTFEVFDHVFEWELTDE